MQGEYNLWIVGLSYLIAVLASYTVLEMAGKVMQPESRTGLWIAAGSAAMGTGIWSMHFVGMEAFTLPIEVIYDIPLTVLSWIAAIAVSALALWTLSRLKHHGSSLDSKIVVISGLLMGLGICVMHYSGMFAMRLSPAITYHLGLFAASFLIAAGAAIVTLLIAVFLRNVRKLSQLLMRGGAALIMGVAITGMHYTGMAAARFAPDAVCLTGIGLETGWTLGPVTLATLIILPLAVGFSVGDTRAIRRRQHRDTEREASRKAEAMAFADQETGLHNRSWLNRRLAQARVKEDGRLTLAVMERSRPLTSTERIEIAKRLQTHLHGDEPVLIDANTFAVLAENKNPDTLQTNITALLDAHQQWRVGLASFPDEAPTPFRLFAWARKHEEVITGGIGITQRCADAEDAEAVDEVKSFL